MSTTGSGVVEDSDKCSDVDVVEDEDQAQVAAVDNRIPAEYFVLLPSAVLLMITT
jgi:hypothetical protein